MGMGPFFPRTGAAFLLASACLSWPLVGAAASAKGDGIEEALGELGALYGQLEYERALSRIQTARDLSRSPEQDALLSMYEGIILCELGHSDQGLNSFHAALLINRHVELPLWVAPKIEAHFEAVRRKLQEEPLELPPSPPAVVEDPPAPVEVQAALVVPLPLPPAPVIEARVCAQSPTALGRSLRAQQLWRLAEIQRLLCARGTAVPEELNALVRLMTGATTSHERMRLSRDIDRFSIQYQVYPSMDVWLEASASLPVSSMDPPTDERSPSAAPAEVRLAAPDPDEDEEPTGLFGCQPAVALRCERFMNALLVSRSRASTLQAASRRAATKELAELSERVRKADTPAVLDAIAHELEAWSRKYPAP